MIQQTKFLLSRKQHYKIWVASNLTLKITWVCLDNIPEYSENYDFESSRRITKAHRFFSILRQCRARHRRHLNRRKFHADRERGESNLFDRPGWRTTENLVSHWSCCCEFILLRVAFFPVIFDLKSASNTSRRVFEQPNSELRVLNELLRHRQVLYIFRCYVLVILFLHLVFFCCSNSNNRVNPIQHPPWEGFLTLTKLRKVSCSVIACRLTFKRSTSRMFIVDLWAHHTTGMKWKKAKCKFHNFSSINSFDLMKLMLFRRLSQLLQNPTL